MSNPPTGGTSRRNEKAAQQWREPLRIVVDHTRPVIRPIQVTGLDDVLALFDTVEDALRAPP